MRKDKTTRYYAHIGGIEIEVEINRLSFMDRVLRNERKLHIRLLQELYSSGPKIGLLLSESDAAAIVDDYWYEKNSKELHEKTTAYLKQYTDTPGDVKKHTGESNRYTNMSDSKITHVFDGGTMTDFVFTGDPKPYITDVHLEYGNPYEYNRGPGISGIGFGPISADGFKLYNSGKIEGYRGHDLL